MSQLTIIGSGILGLVLAEYFSKASKYQVQIISNEDPLSGSNAAAANLATKGQCFGRDPHFKLQLQAKAHYAQWLQSLIQECDCNWPLADILLHGEGVDFFTSQENRDQHWKRVKQADAQLEALNLPLDWVQKYGDANITYKNEMYVDAIKLLLLLRKILCTRKVNFTKAEFNLEAFQKLSKQPIIIFCTGAWTKDLLTNLRLPIPKDIQSQSLTIGSTFSGSNIIANCQNFVLQEKIAAKLRTKVTISGLAQKQHISSSTLKVSSLSDGNFAKLQPIHTAMLELAQAKMPNTPYLNTEHQLERRDGYRVKYGNQALLIEKLSVANAKLLVCAGAHKSGFLYAPILGKIVEQYIFDNFN